MRRAFFKEEYDAALAESAQMTGQLKQMFSDLGKVLYKLGHSPVRPELRIEYTVAEPEKCKNELLENAVLDAKAKAEVLSKASEVSLGEIVTIDYSWAEIDFVSRPMNKLMLEECSIRSCAPDETYEIDINPDDIKVTDNVTVVWGIK